MAVKLRLRREGTKKRPHYRVVAADSRSPRDGRFIEIIGEYHPLDNPSVIKINNERAVHWLSVGAQPTDQVKVLLRISGAWEEFKPGDAPLRDRSNKKPKLNKKAKARAEAEADSKAAAAAEAADVAAAAKAAAAEVKAAAAEAKAAAAAEGAES
ncbi:MAG: small subunit ribosomal protein S16 [Nitriliruptoraceae bacterium]|jgi:small subunit ribosomal protein S16